MDKNHHIDSVFDALFGQAVIDNFYQKYNSIPSLEELSREYTFTEKHEKRMNTLFTKEERLVRLNKFIYFSKKIAAVFFIVITIMIGALMFNPNVRAAVVETIISWHREFVKFVSPDAEAEGTGMVPSYIPAGFFEMHYEEVNDITIIIFINENDETILFQANRALDSLYVDSERSVYEALNIAGVTYHVLTSLYDEEHSIIWEINGWRYFLISVINVETLKEMALSLG